MMICIISLNLIIVISNILGEVAVRNLMEDSLMVVGHSLEVAYPFVATKVIQKLLAIEAIHIKVAFIHIH